MGVPLAGSSLIFADSVSVIQNIKRPELVSKKKSNIICYNAPVKEALAIHEHLSENIPTARSPADLVILLPPGGQATII